MSFYREGVPEHGLFVEHDTERTPDARGYFVFQGGRIVERFVRFTEAHARYRELRELLEEAGHTRKPVEASASEMVRHEVAERFVMDEERYWTRVRGC